MAIEIRPFSRFSGTQIVTKDGHVTFGLWTRPSFVDESLLDDDDVLEIAIDQDLAGRPDLIAQQQYGTPLLAWVVVMFNRPQNPLGWPLTGTTIRLPAASLVR